METEVLMSFTFFEKKSDVRDSTSGVSAFRLSSGSFQEAIQCKKPLLRMECCSVTKIVGSQELSRSQIDSPYSAYTCARLDCDVLSLAINFLQIHSCYRHQLLLTFLLPLIAILDNSVIFRGENTIESRRFM